MIETTKGSRREVTIPAASLVDLFGSANRAELEEYGRSTGRLLAERLLSPQDDARSARALPTTLFWKRVGELFASRGWGTITHRATGQGVGELRATDWVEADRRDASGGCAFSAGVIQGLLEAVSGTRLEVQEVQCRAAGGSACRFLFGTSPALAAARASAQPSVDA